MDPSINLIYHSGWCPPGSQVIWGWSGQPAWSLPVRALQDCRKVTRLWRQFFFSSSQKSHFSSLSTRCLYPPGRRQRSGITLPKLEWLQQRHCDSQAAVASTLYLPHSPHRNSIHSQLACTVIYREFSACSQEKHTHTQTRRESSYIIYGVSGQDGSRENDVDSKTYWDVQSTRLRWNAL